MNCTVQGCTGQYRDRPILHTLKYGADILVFENVPAEVCDVCSDTLLAPETVRHLEELMQRGAKPQRHAPVYVYA